MDKKLLVKTIINFFAGLILWGLVKFVISLADGSDFVDEFFTVSNIVSMVLVMLVACTVYYISQSKKNK
ncbi:MAG: hypothetical protein IKR27_03715 [Lachnospiraceae bacterium]|nr:hypothetical protein [Lachnospiraceae bacterium]